MNIIKKFIIRSINLLFLISGIALFIYMISQIGIGYIYTQIENMGWKFLWILSLHIPVLLCFTIAWFLCTGKKWKRQLFGRLFTSESAGWSMGEVLPLSAVAGEAYKGMVLKDKLESSVVISSLILVNTIHALVTFSMIGVGVVILFISIAISPVIKVLIIALLLVLYFAVGLVMLRQKKGIFAPLLLSLMKIKFLKRLLQGNVKKAAEIDKKMKTFYKANKKRFIWSYLAIWGVKLTSILEYYLIMQFLSYPVRFDIAFLLFVISNIIFIVMFFIPSQIGVTEGGLGQSFKMLGLNPEQGVLLGVFRRLRVVVWIALGFLPALISFFTEKFRNVQNLQKTTIRNSRTKKDIAVEIIK